AYWLRLDAFFSDAAYWRQYAPLFWSSLPVLIGLRLLANWCGGQYNWSFSHAGALEAGRLALTALGATLVFLLINKFWQPFAIAPPRSIYVLEFCLSFIFMGALRFTPKYFYSLYCAFYATYGPGCAQKPTLIYGAGGNAELLVRELSRTVGHPYHLVGFIDDAPSRLNVHISGLKVLGPVDKLPILLKKYNIKEILITIPDFSGAPLRRLIDFCAPFGVSYKIVPPYQSMLSSKRNVLATIEDLKPESLIHRPAVPFNSQRLSEFYCGMTALVTGAAGSIGSEICFQLASKGIKKLVILDIDENGIFFLNSDLLRKAPSLKVNFEIVSVQDKEQLSRVMKKHNPHIVIHAAAHKHVPLMESCPLAAIKNNVLGTLFTAQSALEAGASHFLLISTDKAVLPGNVMGASKRLAELLLLGFKGGPMEPTIVRFGNVLGSNGSLFQIVERQIKEGGPVTVTDPAMTRFFMTIPEAIGLVLSTPTLTSRDIFVLEMGEAINIDQLVRHVISLSGLVPGRDIDIIYTNPRPGEKLSEILIAPEQSGVKTEHPGIWSIEERCPPLNIDDLLLRVSNLLTQANLKEACHDFLKFYVPEYKAVDLKNGE
ncbi:MAG: polysaccharide biosynthesis protein, partial [Candidatus Adiutrix sp.]